MYVDTSVLAAYYCPEALSEQAEALLLAMDRPAISRLTEVELASAVSRKVRMGELSRNDGNGILRLFRSHVNDHAYTTLSVTSEHYAEAEKWIAQFAVPLRTLDALHLAVASASRLSILTADRRLADAADEFGIAVRLIEDP